MAWTNIVLVSTGELATAAVQNTQVLGNLNELRQGGWAVASQAVGDLLTASSATQFTRLAGVATGSVLVSGGVGVAPLYSSSPTVTTLNATTLGGTLSTSIQPNVTQMSGLTSAAGLATIGTITTGTWNGTIVGLTYGGTGSNLSGTGGTSQFLRQNTLGGAVSVVRPAVADLSDASNVALLNAANVFTANQLISKTTATELELRFSDSASYAAIRLNQSGGSSGFIQFMGSTFATVNRRGYAEVHGVSGVGLFPDGVNRYLDLSSAGLLTVSGFGTHKFGAAGGTTSDLMLTLQGGSSAGNGSFIQFMRDATTSGYFGTGGLGGAGNALVLRGETADGVDVRAINSAGTIRVYTGGTTKRAEWESAGFFTTSYGVAFGSTISPPQITANQNDYAPAGHANAFLWRIDETGAQNISGLAGGVSGRIIMLVHITNGNFQLSHEDVASVAANRIRTPTSAAIVGNVFTLVYDGTASRWVVMSWN